MKLSLWQKAKQAVAPTSKPFATPYLGGLPSVPSAGGSVNVRHALPVHKLGVSAK